MRLIALLISLPLTLLARQEYPPAAMSTFGTTITGPAYGNGYYYASASSYYIPGSGYEVAYKAFDKSTSSIENVWTAALSLFSSGSYIGSTSTVYGGITYYGEWLQIQMPSSTTITSYSLSGYDVRMPKNWVLVGGSDGSTWTLVDSHSDYTLWGLSVQYFSVSPRGIPVLQAMRQPEHGHWILYLPLNRRADLHL